MHLRSSATLFLKIKCSCNGVFIPFDSGRHEYRPAPLVHTRDYGRKWATPIYLSRRQPRVHRRVPRLRSDLNSRKSMNKALPWQSRNNGIARYAGHMRNIWHFSRERERLRRPKDEFLKRCTPPCHAPPEWPRAEAPGGIYIVAALHCTDTRNYIVIVPRSSR